METKLEHHLTNSHKAEMIAYIRSHPEDFKEALHLAFSDKQPYSWRAAWILWGCMDHNDRRVRRHVNKIIDILPKRKDNQQRELLMILQRMDLASDQEGRLFNECVRIWRILDKNASLRWNALKIMIAISKKYPDLLREIVLLTGSKYTLSLSSSVKRSIRNLIKDLKQS